MLLSYPMKSSVLLIAITALGLVNAASAQVYIDQRSILVGDTQSDRQVLGIAPGTEPTEALSAYTEQAGLHRFAMVDPGAIWSVQLPALATAPQSGTHILLITPAPVPGDLSLSVNGSSPYAITRYGTDPINAMEIPEGEVLSLVFDGVGFQIMNGAVQDRLDCPSGMVAASTEFCIDLSEHPAMNFYNAALTCIQEGKRLCSWGEYYTACINGSALGIPDLEGNGEWTNNTANYGNVVRVVGSSCSGAGAGVADVTPRAFHCCASR